MKMSTRGRELLKKREGVILHTYTDSVGVLTIGVGHTASAGEPIPTPGMTITAAKADEILARDLAKFEKYVNDALQITVMQNEFDALVSICFNVGPKFATSTCIKRLNTGDRPGAAEAIMLWSRPAEIIDRRRSEQKQFLTPYQGMVAAKKPISKTGATVSTTAGAGAGAAAHQAGLPIWAVVAIAVGVAVAAFLIWKLKK